MRQEQTTIYDTKVVSPKIRNLVGHPWGWVAVGDLVEVLNQDATTVWFQYCHDARQATQSKDWNGKSWTVAIPEEGGHAVKDVWNNKTGNLISTANLAPEAILVPAGWYKNKNKVADQLDESIRAFFTYYRNHEQMSLHDAGDCKVIVEANTAGVEKAIAAIGTVAQLESSLARIISRPDGLELDRHEDEKENILYLKFRNRALDHYMTVSVWIRMVVGEVKVHQVSVWNI